MKKLKGSSFLKICCLLGAASCVRQSGAAPEPVLKVATDKAQNLLQNAAFELDRAGQLAVWKPYGDGFSAAPKQGREGRNAIRLQRKTGEPARGIMQQVTLNQKVPTPIAISGWAKTENVSSSASVDFSLYADLQYQDGSSLWGQIGSFVTGTHDWQRVRYVVLPAQPIKSISFYALMRGPHYGTAWISDLALSQIGADGTPVFDGVPVTLPVSSPASTLQGQSAKYQTRDGLALEVSPENGGIRSLRIGTRELATRAAPSGFLVRDVAAESDYFAFQKGKCEPLQLQLDSKISEAADHIAIEGTLRDSSARDRAVTLVFALPVNARGWKWGTQIRAAQTIVPPSEYSNSVPFDAGSNGRHSQYPFANIHDARDGLALAVDVEHAAQYRLAYNSGTQQFFIAYDFGLVPEQPQGAKFRFVLYKTDAAWGFRDAARRYYAIYPDWFQVRDAAKKQGLWMPFTNIETVQNWADFGFRFREAGITGNDAKSVAFDDKNDFLTLRYTEPMTWWMNMPPDMPRTYENAIAQVERIAANPQDPHYRQAKAVLSSGFKEENGRFALQFLKQPWGDGAVWSLNPDPNLPGEITEAKNKWSREIIERYYENFPNGTVDGEYLDSLEGYVTANLNFNREHFKYATMPLTFSLSERQPAQHKSLLAFAQVRAMSRDLHRMGKLLMANGLPHRFGFFMPWLDTAGTEANWMYEGKYTPDTDAMMSLRRTLSAAKPYHILQNTNFEAFDSSLVERYMQRCLFYGIYPSFFSYDAANDAYFTLPKFYNRDRHLFVKYVPLVKQIGEAGWQPVTLARSDNPQIWLERFGEASGNGAQYLTLYNASEQPQNASISLQKPLTSGGELSDLISGVKVAHDAKGLRVSLPSQQAMLLRLR